MNKSIRRKQPSSKRSMDKEPPEPFSDPSLYINRELSWLEFNQRVLEEGEDSRNPLLERLKFLCIVASNLDEFFEVRVAGLKQQRLSNISAPGPDGLSPSEQLAAVSVRVRKMVDDQYRLWNEELVPNLERNNIFFLRYEELTDEERQYYTEYFEKSVYPVLTPLAVDPVHPFPQLLNKSLNVAVELHGVDLNTNLAVVQVPRILPRLLPYRAGKRGVYRYIFIGNLIQAHVGSLFHGVQVDGAYQFRVTRNSDLYLDEEETDNLLKAIELELRKRSRGNAVRLEVQKDCPSHITDQLLQTFDLTNDDLYRVDGPINFLRLMPVISEVDRPDLKFRPFAPAIVIGSGDHDDIFSRIRRRPILVHHPYESFQTVLDFIEQAADDPNVLAIKQTLYRTSGDSQIVGSLAEAAERGKQVTVAIELKARFDEAANIKWARTLQEAGVHVVYGIVGLKTHAKLALVVRREEDGLRRYLHLGTGNYHPSTAKLYTDIGLLTCDPDLTNDSAELFNWLTGVSVFPDLKKIKAAPKALHEFILEMIQRETENATKGRPAGIFGKVNSLVDPEVIQALYRASQAGVKIKLMVRGVCCLRSKVPGTSDNIVVRSVVSRFLEHSRIYRFENAGKPLVYLASADWMARNFFRRVETCFPIEDPELRSQIDQILDIYWRDNVKAREQGSEFTYVRRPINDGRIDAQAIFLEGASKQKRADVDSKPVMFKTSARDTKQHDEKIGQPA
ncbi:MAG: polyphosphate kinase 1 [Verrucomicrobia bacterium]|nr:polyphosphate kinase 1 [Verrucomicrobiota bacterium]MBV9645505.1 polyphosphate kinase 1 [Verrucomicrobiota bacterium]